MLTFYLKTGTPHTNRARTLEKLNKQTDRITKSQRLTKHLFSILLDINIVFDWKEMKDSREISIFFLVQLNNLKERKTSILI